MLSLKDAYNEYKIAGTEMNCPAKYLGKPQQDKLRYVVMVTELQFELFPRELKLS